MLLITLLALAVVWAAAVLVVVGVCVNAARGDRALTASARTATDARQLRLTV
jgi:hypothetical protein